MSGAPATRSLAGNATQPAAFCQMLLLRFEQEAACTTAHGESFSPASLFAECVSALSERLNQDELQQMICVGTGIYQCGVREIGQGVPAEDRLPARECWARKIRSALYQ